MRAVVFATGIVGILSLIWGLAGLAPMNTGVFEQKNTMGKSMVMLWIAALAMSLDGGTGPRGRMLAGILAAVAFFLGVASESATAVLLMIGTGGIILLGQIVLKGGINRPGVPGFGTTLENRSPRSLGWVSGMVGFGGIIRRHSCR